MATSSAPVAAGAPAQQAPAPGHRDFYAEGQSQAYAQQPYEQPPQSPFYAFNPSMPYPNDKAAAPATGHFTPYQPPQQMIPVEYRFEAQPHGRSKRLTRTVLGLHIAFLLIGLGWLGLSAYIFAYDSKALGFSSGELLFVLAATFSVITDGTAIGLITIADKLPAWTTAMDLITIFVGILRFVPGVETRSRVVLGDADYDRWAEHMWVATIISIFLLIAVICCRIVSMVSMWMWQSRERRGMVQVVAVPMQ